jgi:hypothetical protein
LQPPEIGLRWLPWQSQLAHFHRWRPLWFHRLGCGFIAKTTLDIRTHILSSLRCDLGKMYFKSFIVLMFNLSEFSCCVGVPLVISNPWPPIPTSHARQALFI